MYARNVLLEKVLDDALDELPEDEREVFLGARMDGTQLQRTGGRNRAEREYITVAETLCGAASAQTAACSR